MMKAKIIGSVLIIAFLSSCLSNQSLIKQSPTNALVILTSTKVLPTVSATPNVFPSKPGPPRADDLTAVANSSLTEIAAALSATPAPYVDFPSLRETPEGGWKTYKSTQYGFSFEYPSSYDTGSCGKLVVSKSVQQSKIQFEGGTISITIATANNTDLKTYAQQLIDTIDGVPALRFGLRRGAPMSAQYEKLALMIHQGKLYLFEYSLVNFVWCDAPPISEEAVYEHLISTWHFLP